MEILNTDGLLRLYTSQLDTLQKGVGNSINSMRSKAIDSFKQTGIPDKKVEKYKYTDLKQAFEQSYHVDFSIPDATINTDEISRYNIPVLDSYKIYLLNGFCYGEKKLENINGVIFGSLALASLEYPQLVEKYYNQKAGSDNADETTLLNTAFAHDGVFIYFPKSATLDKPIQIINLLTGSQNVFVQCRNLFVFEENAQAKIIKSDHTLGANRILTNEVSEIFVAPLANAELVNLQNENDSSVHISSHYVAQAKQSVYNSHTITLNGGVIRNNINVEFTGEYGENHTYGLYITDKQQHVDNHSFIDHAVPNCVSNELFKGVMNHQSTGVFNGRILVRQDAQKTLAFQTNNNLLLSANAKINTKPQLEIYADDVKCSHGATVGQLNEEAIFYMRSRGIGIDEANLLQLLGYTHDVLLKINAEDIRETLINLVDQRLRGELHPCDDCHLLSYKVSKT